MLPRVYDIMFQTLKRNLFHPSALEYSSMHEYSKVEEKNDFFIVGSIPKCLVKSLPTVLPSHKQ